MRWPIIKRFMKDDESFPFLSFGNRRPFRQLEKFLASPIDKSKSLASRRQLAHSLIGSWRQPKRQLVVVVSFALLLSLLLGSSIDNEQWALLILPLSELTISISLSKNNSNNNNSNRKGNTHKDNQMWYVWKRRRVNEQNELSSSWLS